MRRGERAKVWRKSRPARRPLTLIGACPDCVQSQIGRLIGTRQCRDGYGGAHDERRWMKGDDEKGRGKRRVRVRESDEEG